MRITQGTFSYLPDLTDSEIRAQVQYAIDQGWAVAIEFTDDPHPRNVLWEMWGLPMFEISDASAAMHEVTACRKAWPDHYIRVCAYDATLGLADDGAELHRQPTGSRAGLPAGPAGGIRPADPVLAACPLRDGPAGRRAPREPDRRARWRMSPPAAGAS